MSKAAELAKLIGDGTFGTGVAEDKKIVFDGNAQDYHIGLDDSTDSLTIGKGTALGTTPHIVSNASGHVTLPSTPGFCVVGSPSKDGNNDLHSFQSVKFNTGSHYNNSNGKFTVPIDGNYLVTGGVRIAGSNTYGTLFVMLNGSDVLGGEATIPGDYGVITCSAVYPFEAGDLINLRCTVSISGSTPRNYFSMFLLG
tara:strand:- start:1637 stop:2227 length:591 start_codon:yes stop_codon:yes gene_type:complete